VKPVPLSGRAPLLSKESETYTVVHIEKYRARHIMNARGKIRIFPRVHFQNQPLLLTGCGPVRITKSQGIGQTLFFIVAARALFSFRDEKEDTISGFCVDEGLVLNI
jgi:hypothetical protein